MFTLAINTGLGVLELLNLKVKDIKGKHYLSVGKQKSVPLNNEIIQLVERFTENKNPSELLFQNSKGNKVGRTALFYDFKGLCTELGLNEKYSKKYDSDISLATNIRVGKRKSKKRLNITEEKVVSGLQDKFDICQQWKNECPTNKIYRHSMLKANKIVWPENCYCEDKLYTVQAVYYANSVVTVPNVNYYYFRNPNSTVNSKAKKHFKQLIDHKNNARRSVLAFLKRKNAQIRDKDFWAVKNEFRIMGVTIFKIEESLQTTRFVLFGISLFSSTSKKKRGGLCDC